MLLQIASTVSINIVNIVKQCQTVSNSVKHCQTVDHVELKRDHLRPRDYKIATTNQIGENHQSSQHVKFTRFCFGESFPMDVKVVLK